MSLTASDGTGLRLVSMSAQTVVDDPVVYTELSLTFENPESRQLEGRFRMVLPEGASVGRFAMRIGENWQEGEYLPKQAARRTYEDFLHRRQDPALLEAGAGNEFSARVFPIAANEKKHLILSYSQVLAPGSRPIVPLDGLPEVEHLDVAITRAGESQPLSKFAKVSHRPGGDVMLDRAQRNSNGGLRSGDMALMRVHPEIDGAVDPLGSTLVLVDASASRVFDYPQQVELVQRLVRQIASADAKAQVSVATFDQEVALIYEGAAANFGAAETERLSARQALGASDLEKALQWAERHLSAHPKPRVLVIGDGVVTAGDDEGELMGRSASALSAAGVQRIDAIALGGVRDTAMLKHLVATSVARRGVVISGEAQMGEMLRRLTRGSQTNVPIEVEGASWWYPTHLEGAQPGDEVMVVATLKDPKGVPTVRIGGKSTPMPNLTTTDERLMRMVWASAQIEDLTTQERKDGHSDERAAQITALSVKHRVSSPYTSLLVLETEGDYQRYGIPKSSLGDILTVQGGRLTTVERGQLPTSPAVAASSEPGPWENERSSAARSSAARSSAARSAAPMAQNEASAMGNLWGEEIGESFGAGGLGLVGVGEGGGGRAETGLGRGSGQGFGQGSGRLGGSHRTRAPSVRMGATQVSGRLPPEVIQRIVRQNFGRFRFCYEQALLKQPNLSGRISVSFIIGRDGAVASSAVNDTQLNHAVMERCVLDAFASLTFPQPESGIIKVVYPIVFAPGGGRGGETSTPTARPMPMPMSMSSAPRKMEPASPEPKPTPAPYRGRFGDVMHQIDNHHPAAALAEAAAWRAESPSDVLSLVALGEALEAGGHRDFAARAYGSIVDLYPDRADLRRFAGGRLERIGTRSALESARDTYQKARRDRPDHPSSHRLLAYAELALGHHEKAFEVLASALDERSRTGNFAMVRQIFVEDLGLIGAAWIHAAPEARSKIMTRLSELGATLSTQPSMRVVMTWESDQNDVDLHVYDDEMGHAFHGSRRLESGGSLYADITTGYGPECFSVLAEERRHATKEYDLFAHYYRRGPMGYGMGKVQVIHHDGNGTLEFEERPYVVMDDDAYVALGSVKARFF